MAISPRKNILCAFLVLKVSVYDIVLIGFAIVNNRAQLLQWNCYYFVDDSGLYQVACLYSIYLINVTTQDNISTIFQQKRLPFWHNVSS